MASGVSKIRIILVSLLYCGIFAQIDEDPNIAQLEDESANYLHNVMNQIQQEKENDQSIEIMELTNIVNMERVSEHTPDLKATPYLSVNSGSINGPTPSPLHAEMHPLSPPPPTLTANELNTIYKTALMKGTSLNQLQIDHLPTQADNGAPSQAVQPLAEGIADSKPGYHYYFYPIKSFTEEDHNSADHKKPMMTGHDNMAVEEDKKPAKQPVEPLFMAVSGFMGMALMFIVSVLFLPKFNNLKSGIGPESKEDPHELAVLAKLIFESIDGKDCTERMACEIGRIVRSMRMGKAIKVMEIILPPNVSRQITLIRKAAVKNEKCNFIPCRFTTNRPPSKTANSKPWQKRPTPHELWMKHFEKNQKDTKKKPNNVWNKKS